MEENMNIENDNSYQKTNVEKKVPFYSMKDIVSKFMVNPNIAEDNNLEMLSGKDSSKLEICSRLSNTLQNNFDDINIKEGLTRNSSNESSKSTSKVNHPSHYNSVKKETIKILDDYLTDEEYDGFLKGNVLKYIHRYKFKNGVEDLNKAKWYLEELIRKNTR